MARTTDSIRKITVTEHSIEKLTELPKDLPTLIDNGACNYLLGQSQYGLLKNTVKAKEI
jgi:hypothetical protein